MSSLSAGQREGIGWFPRCTVEKYSAEQTRRARAWLRRASLPGRCLNGSWMRVMFGEPEGGIAYDEGNGVALSGLSNLAALLTGGGYPLEPGRACFGVGSDASPFDPNHAHLSPAGGEAEERSLYLPMDPGFPRVAGPVTVEGQATFSETDACFPWNEWCTTSMTEILTRAGWKHYDELLVGEDVLTLDCSTGLSRWQPLQRVHVWPSRVRRMRVFDSARGLRSVTTADHRWPVLRGSELQWATSEELAGSDRILRAVPHDGFPAEPKYADSFVRLIAHYWCDGWVRHRNRPSLQGGMGASREDKLASMRKGLTALPPGSWGENRRASDDVTLFRFNKAAMEVLAAVAPEHVPSYAFLGDLTEAQLRLFTDVCLRLGDGGGDGSRGLRPYFSQTDKHGDGVGRFQFVCALQGIATNTRDSAPSAGRFTSRAVHKVRPLASSSIAVKDCGDQGWADVEDVVWCPQTPDTTWLARDRGSVYWTGNCWATGGGRPRAGHTLRRVYDEGTSVMMNRKAPPAGFGVKEPGVAWCFRTEIVMQG